MQNRISNQKAGRAGFSLIELTIVIAMISLLAGILFPVFSRTRENSSKSLCANNLRQLAASEFMYARDYDGVMQVYYFSAPGVPAAPTWRDVLLPYTKSYELYNCPSRSPRWNYNGNSFNWSLNATPISKVKRHSEILFFSDSDVDDTIGPEDDAIGWADDFHPAHANMMRIHDNKANVCFFDGHVRTLDPATLRQSNFEL